jgi:hypothetical protein
MTAHRRATARPTLALVLATAVAVSLAACGLTAVAGPREWRASAARADGTSVEIVVRDTSGRIAEVEFDPANVQPPVEIANAAGDATVILVPWAGGSCDTLTEFSFVARGQGLVGTVRTTTTGQVCDMMAIQHVLRLTMTAPMPAALVTLDPAPPQ